MGVPQNRGFLMLKILIKWMIWGTPFYETFMWSYPLSFNLKPSRDYFTGTPSQISLGEPATRLLFVEASTARALVEWPARTALGGKQRTPSKSVPKLARSLRNGSKTGSHQEAQKQKRTILLWCSSTNVRIFTVLQEYLSLWFPIQSPNASHLIIWSSNVELRQGHGTPKNSFHTDFQSVPNNWVRVCIRKNIDTSCQKIPESVELWSIPLENKSKRTLTIPNLALSKNEKSPKLEPPIIPSVATICGWIFPLKPVFIGDPSPHHCFAITSTKALARLPASKGKVHVLPGLDNQVVIH